MTSHLYLSPHLDDAVFSCGGLIAAQSLAGETVQVVTLYARDPPTGPLSPFALKHHERWGVGDEPVAIRRHEDHAACDRVGGTPVHLEHPEALYRQDGHGEWVYTTDTDLFGSPAPVEEDLIRTIRSVEGLRPQDSLVYCPLAVGGHVDHQLTRLVAEGLGLPLRYYYDFPYAAREGEVPSDLGLPEGDEELFPLSSEAMEIWADAISAYRSQLSTFWTDFHEIHHELRAYHDAHGGVRILVGPEEAG